MQSPDGIFDRDGRLQAEMELLRAMYQDSVTFTPATSELSLKPVEHPGAQIVLRLPEDYPGPQSPQVVSACDSRKADLRENVADEIKELAGQEVEILDAVIQRFFEYLDSGEHRSATIEFLDASQPQASKTVIIWLHHLLATSKRKLALHPTSSSDEISGITKPGHPGIMVFTGPSHAVDDHVRELKALNWQAFQVRLEEKESWKLGKGGELRGMIEVETMAEVVQHLEEGRKAVFLKAIGVK
jgi:hypothetical protein